MWILALLGMRTGVGFGLIVAFVTDFLDGPIARRLNQTSDFGAQFDSLADQLVQLSAIPWVLMLMPEIFKENLFASVLAISVYLVSISIGIIKFKRVANLHLYLSKLSGLLLYVFIVHALFTGQYNRILFLLACGAFVGSSSETLVLQLATSRVDEHIGSILFLHLPSDHLLRRLSQKLP